MTKHELITHVAANSELGRREAEAAIEALADLVNVEVRSGREITIPGLGKFSRKQREARTARNPQTGETIQVAARRVPAFKAVKEFRDAVA